MHRTNGESILTRLKPSTCKIILIERLILRQTDTLDELAKFLMMDENKDVYRMLQKIMQKIDEDNVSSTKYPWWELPFSWSQTLSMSVMG